MLSRMTSSDANYFVYQRVYFRQPSLKSSLPFAIRLPFIRFPPASLGWLSAIDDAINATTADLFQVRVWVKAELC